MMPRLKQSRALARRIALSARVHYRGTVHAKQNTQQFYVPIPPGHRFITEGTDIHFIGETVSGSSAA